MANSEHWFQNFFKQVRLNMPWFFMWESLPLLHAFTHHMTYYITLYELPYNRSFQSLLSAAAQDIVHWLPHSETTRIQHIPQPSPRITYLPRYPGKICNTLIAPHCIHLCLPNSYMSSSHRRYQSTCLSYLTSPLLVDMRSVVILVTAPRCCHCDCYCGCSFDFSYYWRNYLPRLQMSP